MPLEIIWIIVILINFSSKELIIGKQKFRRFGVKDFYHSYIQNINLLLILSLYGIQSGIRHFSIIKHMESKSPSFFTIIFYKLRDGLEANSCDGVRDL